MNAIVKGKTFRTGNSVAVRLPARFGFAENTEVQMEHDGRSVIVTPLHDPVAEKRKLSELVAALRAIGPVGEIEERVPIEYPDRPGLY